MELHQLRYFLAVVDHRSFTKAADTCGIAQPSLSQQIGKLESELAAPLFHRLGRRIELTQAGSALVPRAREVLSTIADIPTTVTAAARDVAGRLRIGSVPTVARYVLPDVVRPFLVDYPEACAMLLYRGKEKRMVDGILCWPVEDFLLQLKPNSWC